MRILLLFFFLSFFICVLQCSQYEQLLSNNTRDAGLQEELAPDDPILVNYFDVDKPSPISGFTTFRLNHSRTAFYDTRDVIKKPTPVWEGKLFGKSPYPIFFHKNRIYASSRNGFSVYDYPSKLLLWNYQSKKALSIPTITTDSILLSNSSGELISFGLQSRRENWRTSSSVPTISSPVANEKYAFYTTYSRQNVSDVSVPFFEELNLYANRLSDGKVMWKARFSQKLSSFLLLASNMIFLVSRDSHSGSGMLLSIESTTGKVIWKRRLNDILFGHLVFSGGILYLTTDSSISAIQPNTGKQLWTFSVENSQSLRTSVFSTTMVYVSNKHLSALDLQNRKVLWTNADVEICGSPIVGNKQIYVTGCKHRLLSFSTSNGKLIWSYQRGFPEDFYKFSNLSIYEGLLFVSTTHNAFEMFE